MNEIWKSVVGFEGLYEVSDCGRVRSASDWVDSQGRRYRRRILRQSLRPDGYLCVSFCRGMKISRLVHAVVLSAFRGPRLEKHEGAHEDGNKLNCRLTNLNWKLPAANAEDRIRHGTSGKGIANSRAKLTEHDVQTIRRLASDGVVRRDIALRFGVTETAVDKIVWRTTWGHV